MPDRAVVVALVACLAMSACVDPVSPGVRLRAVEADIAFGLPDEDAPTVLPANTLPSFPPIDLGSILDLDLPELPKFVPPEIPEALLPCKADDGNTFPALAAAVRVPDGIRPAEGIYLWQITGEAEIPGLPIAVGGGGVELRAVRRVQDVTDTIYTFQTLQANWLPPFGLVETTWQVKTENVGTVPVEGPVIPSDPTQLPELPSEVPTEVPEIPEETYVVAGEPDRGISIAGMRYLDAELQEVASFQPALPLLILPLPVRVKERVNSTAIDPLTLQSITFQGQVQPSERINACSAVVEGWRVEGTLQVNDGSTTAVSEREWVFMPQYGGMIAREKVNQTTTIEGADGEPIPVVIDLDSVIRQIAPLPLPEELT